MQTVIVKQCCYMVGLTKYCQLLPSMINEGVCENIGQCIFDMNGLKSLIKRLFLLSVMDSIHFSLQGNVQSKLFGSLYTEI